MASFMRGPEFAGAASCRERAICISYITVHPMIGLPANGAIIELSVSIVTGNFYKTQAIALVFA